jgi:hypothetical protein
LKDFGHPQFTSTEQVKGYIVNEPVAIVQTATNAMSNFKPNFFHQNNTKSSIGAQRPVGLSNEKKNKNNEIFVDIFEKISVKINTFTSFFKECLDPFQCQWLCYKFLH